MAILTGWTLDGGYLCYPVNPAYNYEIRLKECSTVEDVSRWILHLSGKKWGSRPVLESFARIVSRECSVDLDAAMLAVDKYAR